MTWSGIRVLVASGGEFNGSRLAERLGEASAEMCMVVRYNSAGVRSLLKHSLLLCPDGYSQLLQ